MVAILSGVVSIFVFRFRSRAALELKLVALQHQLAVLRRQRPGRPQLSSLDRLLWVLLYRIWPQVIDAMVLIKPATVVEWHRRGAGAGSSRCTGCQGILVCLAVPGVPRATRAAVMRQGGKIGLAPLIYGLGHY
jgi:hypothetical protein